MPVNTSLASRITRAVRKRNSSSNDTLSLRWFSHKKKPKRHFYLKHLLQAQCLGTHLNFIRTVRFGFTYFVFHRRHGYYAAPFLNIDGFHHICNTMNPPLYGRNVQRTQYPFSPPVFRHSRIDTFMKHLSLCCELILFPATFQMDQRTLPGTVQVMLQCRQRNRVWARNTHSDRNRHLRKNIPYLSDRLNQ